MIRFPKIRSSIILIIIVNFIFPDSSETNEAFDKAFSYYKEAKWDSAQFYFNEVISNNNLK